MKPSSVIFGCSGTVLSREEYNFFSEVNPFGFILFQRNCKNPKQVRELIISLRDVVNREDVPILIDQEGGRVQRLKPPHWRLAPAALNFFYLYEQDKLRALEAVWLNSRLIAHELTELGIHIDCAPVIDLLQSGADQVIGDRSYGSDPAIVSALARAACEGFLSGGVIPVIKHIPGHGRANVDSHNELPCVETDEQTLMKSDFIPFKNLCKMPWAMTAHIIFKSLDQKKPATLSRQVINLIRNKIGFDGVLLSDDLSMHALSGPFKNRSAEAIIAGCDLVLHCNGNLDEMTQVISGCGPISDKSEERIEKAGRIPLEKYRQLDFDYSEGVQKLKILMK